MSELGYAAHLMEMIERETIAEWVPISKLFVDRYGRPVSDHAINKMMRGGFKPNSLGTIMLSLREDGRYAILDGNHRTQYARKWGVLRMHARVFIDKTYEEEAALFADFNSTNRPTALDRFRARLEAGDEIAHDIQRILARHSLTIGIDGQGHGTVQSVGAIDKVYSELGPLGLDRVVEILHGAWGYERKAWVQPMVEGMRQFWARYGEECDIPRLIGQMKLLTPEQILAQAGLVALRTASPGTLIGMTLVDRYNRGLRSRRLPDWVEHPGRRPASNQASA